MKAAVSTLLINTVALARCGASEWNSSRFNGFRTARSKAVETVDFILTRLHRAKATVLMRNFQ